MAKGSDARYRAALARLLVEPQTPIDLADRELFVAAQQEGVGGLLLAGLLQNGTALPDADRQLAERLIGEQAAWAMRLRHASARVFAALNREGIPFLSLRGPAVAEPLYGKLAPLRPQSDIDLLIDEGEQESARALLAALGYRRNRHYPDIYSRGDIAIDLHREALGAERIRAWRHLTPLSNADLFAASTQGQLAGEAALQLHDSMLLAYLAFHALKHSCARLIWLWDIALLARRIEHAGGWEEVQSTAARFGLQRPLYYVLAYAQAHLAAPVPNALLNGLRPMMGWRERRLFARYMAHRQIPYMAERLFARMQPDLRHRIEFWRETIYPRYEVRQQIAGAGCVRCNFTRKRLKQVAGAIWQLLGEGVTLRRGR